MKRIATLLAALCLPGAIGAQAPSGIGFPLELEAGRSAWKAALEDAQYDALRAPNFTDVQVVDANGEPLDWALCLRTQPELVSAAIPVTAVPLAGRAALDVDGRVTLRTGAGFQAREYRSLVLDTRDRGAVRSISIPGWQGAVVTVRTSPDLRQWSNRVPVSARSAQGGLRLEFPALPANFVQIERADGFAEPAEGVTADFESDTSVVETAWYTPPTLAPGQVRHVRPLPVHAARAAPEGRTRWALMSRDRERNPWKPRGSGAGPQVLEFSALPDAFWRTEPPVPGLQLGHSAYELRIAAARAQRTATLVIGGDHAAGSRLSCDAERWNSAGRAAFVDAAPSSPVRDRRADEPTNIRGVFLTVLALVAVAGWAVRLIIGRSQR